MHSLPVRWVRAVAVVALGVLGSACRSETADCARCGRLGIAATGDPSHLLPPLAVETVARDIGDQVYERLADLAPGAAPIDTAAYRPALAARWEHVDSVTWRFHLRPAARWQDGRPVTAEDVRFSFEAFADSALDAPARPYLEDKLTVTVEDSTTILVRFAEPSAEELFDATYHVRVLPSHIWSQVPRDRWSADTTIAHLVGSGPYRIAEWRRAEYVRLVADSAMGARIRHLRIPGLSHSERRRSRPASGARRRRDPAGARARGGPRDPGALRVRARRQGATGTDVAASVDLG